MRSSSQSLDLLVSLSKLGFETVKIEPTIYCRLRKKGKELTVEFCLGDYCVGIFDENLNLIQPKTKCQTPQAVLIAVKALSEVYL